MRDWIAEPGAWAIGLIMIVVASWMFYRYFAPHSWREWAGAGLVQAGMPIGSPGMEGAFDAAGNVETYANREGQHSR